MSTSAPRYQLVVLFYFLFVLASFQCMAQNRGVRSQYQGISLQERMAVMGAMKNAYDQMENDFNSLLSYISEILSQNIDAEMRELMTREYKAVSTLQGNFHQYGLANIRPAFNEMRSRIQREVVDYNNRIARAQGERRHSSVANSVSETWSGTGFALNNGYIVTNAHVVDKAKTVLVYGINGNMSIGYAAKVIRIDRVADLAIIQIVDTLFPGFNRIPYAIKKELVDIGEDVWVLGYPLTRVLGNEIKLTNGIISSSSGFQGDPSTYQISAPVQPGNSGGPLFDSKGNVVGIVNSGIPGAENVGYAVKSYRLFNLVESVALSDQLPSSSSISSMSLKDQVKRVRDFVFLLICTSSSVSSGLTSVAQPVSSSSSPNNTQHAETSMASHRKIITGTIRSAYDRAIIVDAKIKIKGTSQYTFTNASGQYEIKASPQDILEFTAPHFTQTNMHVGIYDTLDVSLIPSIEEERFFGFVRTNNNKELKGVVVRVKGTNHETRTDRDGYYSIIAKKGDILIFSHPRRKTMEISLGSDLKVNIIMSN